MEIVLSQPAARPHGGAAPKDRTIEERTGVLQSYDPVNKHGVVAIEGELGAMLYGKALKRSDPHLRSLSQGDTIRFEMEMPEGGRSRKVWRVLGKSASRPAA